MKAQIIKNISIEAPDLSGAYHTPDKFFVVSYEEHNGNRELVSQSFTSIDWAQSWILSHKEDFIGELRIHMAKMVGEAISDSTVASYS